MFLRSTVFAKPVGIYISGERCQMHPFEIKQDNKIHECGFAD
jgi:hypothetical protein